MSDSWITLVPENPHFIPAIEDQLRARDRLAEIAQAVDGIEICSSEFIHFFDCGENLERIRCSSCDAEIPIAWWQERMGEDYDGGFRLASYRTPCCNTLTSLNQLSYQWPQAFGRFALDAMNPRIGRLDDEYLRELESLLGTKLLVIYQHI